MTREPCSSMLERAYDRVDHVWSAWVWQRTSDLRVDSDLASLPFGAVMIAIMAIWGLVASYLIPALDLSQGPAAVVAGLALVLGTFLTFIALAVQRIYRNNWRAEQNKVTTTPGSECFHIAESDPEDPNTMPTAPAVRTVKTV